MSEETREIELLRKAIEEYSEEIKTSRRLTREYNGTLNEMADYLIKYDMTEIFCDEKDECENNCKLCVIEYFKKKARYKDE